MKKWAWLFGLLSLLLVVSASGESLPPDYPTDEGGERIVNDVQRTPVPTNDAYRVFYEIFVGSFSDSNGDGIGDLRGIINRMDYLNDGDPASGKSLGVEGLWLTPIFASPSYHKYDVTDYYAIDPAFGTMDDLRELLRVCHERNVWVILDLPINHTSRDNRWFQRFRNARLMGNTNSEYYDFYVSCPAGSVVPAGRHFSPLPGQPLMYEANFSDNMPEPDFDHPFVRQTMLDVALYYLDLGVDGFRFDAAKYIYLGEIGRNADFWQWYIGELKKVKPDVYTVAEVWDSDGIIEQYIPAVNCFHFTGAQAEGLFASTAKQGDVNRLTAYTEKYLKRIAALRPDAMMMPFLSNHDMDRCAGYLTAASGNLKMAANLYLLSPGSPFLYYGEEIALRGSRGGSNTDANRRLAMLWGDGDTVRDPEGATYDLKKQTPYSAEALKGVSDSIYTYYKRLLMLRAANPEIARGQYTALSLPGTKVGGFTAAWQGKTVGVLHNTTLHDKTVTLLGIPALSGFILSDSIGLGKAAQSGNTLLLPAQTTAILREAND